MADWKYDFDIVSNKRPDGEPVSESDSNSEDELHKKADSSVIGDYGVHPANNKRKRPSSFYDGRTACRSRPNFSLKSLRTVAVPNPEGRLPSPAPFAPQVMDTLLSNYHNPGGLYGDILQTLVEVTFRPYSPHSLLLLSFTAVIHTRQL